MRRDSGVKAWERARGRRRQRAAVQLWRLRMERMSRRAGRFYGTRATAYGDVQSGPQRADPSRVLLALVLFAAVAAATLLGLAIAGPDLLHGVHAPPAAPQRRAVTICIQQGESMRAVAAALHRRSLIADASYFYWYWYLRPDAVRGALQVQAGRYVLRTGMSLDALTEALLHGPRGTCRVAGRPRAAPSHGRRSGTS
jgi:hypothetical protein